MYFDYLQERLGYEVMQNDYGFIVLQIIGTDCYLHELYVRPEHRRKQNATYLADCALEKAKQSGCTKLWSQVVITTNGANEAMAAHLAWGMRLHSTDAGRVILSREI